jgi:hypothetical protein
MNPYLGLGKDLRIEGGGIIGSGLLHDEALLYLSVFAKPRVWSRAGPVPGWPGPAREASSAGNQVRLKSCPKRCCAKQEVLIVNGKAIWYQ